MAAEILDSHVHLLDPVGLTYPWLGDLTIGQQPCDAARFAADASSVTGAIVVEAGVAPGKASREVSWVRAQAASYSWIRGMVASAPVNQPAALETVLDAYRTDGMVVGVRCNLQDEPPGFLRDHALRAGVRRLGECGLPFDACVRSWQLTELEELAAACPDTVIVLDHAGKPRCGAGVASWLIALLALARHPNVRCKLSGLATEAAPCARPSALRAALRAALDAFGADRCLFGSDWPICTMATSHRTWLDLVKSVLDGMRASDAERDQVLARTAQLTYRLRGVPPLDQLDQGEHL
jgi:L-fuconolactonase